MSTEPKRKNTPITEYWYHFYLGNDLCTLCANSGVIDTTGLKSRMGAVVGRKNWCICPNGQTLRHQTYGSEVTPDSFATT